jgi:hypothetical protein
LYNQVEMFSNRDAQIELVSQFVMEFSPMAAIRLQTKIQARRFRMLS